eukprot:945954-Alexandrium_andersonii.AAC.1
MRRAIRSPCWPSDRSAASAFLRSLATAMEAASAHFCTLATASFTPKTTLCHPDWPGWRGGRDDLHPTREARFSTASHTCLTSKGHKAPGANLCFAARWPKCRRERAKTSLEPCNGRSDASPGVSGWTWTFCAHPGRRVMVCGMPRPRRLIGTGEALINPSS